MDYFDLDNFKMYYKNMWKYFKRYIGFFDVDRKDIQLINNLNDILNLLLYETPLEEWECQTCILFTKALLYTISTYDIHIYGGGFYSDGVLYIPLLPCAGQAIVSKQIDEFDENFNKFCEQYQEYEGFWTLYQKE